MLTIDTAEAMAALSLIAARASNMTPLLAKIGAMQVTATKERIQHFKDTPWGAQWEPWKVSTAMARHRKGNAEQGLLWDSGALLESIRFESDLLGVSIGSDLPYAPYLQDGTGEMVARPYLGWTPDDYPQLEALALIFLETGQ